MVGMSNGEKVRWSVRREKAATLGKFEIYSERTASKLGPTPVMWIVVTKRRADSLIASVMSDADVSDSEQPTNALKAVPYSRSIAKPLSFVAF